jgi:phosphate starvation-inducible PhoH-like protein
MKRNQKVQTELIKKEKFQRVQFPVLLPKNENQSKLLEGLKHDTIVVASGSAGTGKTLLACWHAAKKLHYGDIRKIILIRAYQPLAGRSIGFLPGTVEEKLLPYYKQMLDYIEDYLGKGSLEIALKTGVVEICPLETVRGRSWDDSIIIVDESQNLYPEEVQALVTRLGENSQMILCGDNAQNDMKGKLTGLAYLSQLVHKYNIPEVTFVEFTKANIVRSGITKAFVEAFEEEFFAEQANKPTIYKSKKG